MDWNLIIEQSGIPFLMFLLCAYEAFKLMHYHDVKAIRSKNAKKLKHEKEYAEQAGKLFLFFGVANLVMGILILFSPMIGLIEIIAATVFFAWKWRKLNEQYQ